jgi:hypothetical protein
MFKPQFQTYNVKQELFEPGRLVTLAEEIYAGKDSKSLNKLTTSEYMQLPSIYGCIDPTKQAILDFKDKDELVTSNNKIITGADLRAITMLMYDKPRSAYVNLGKVKQVHESIYSGAVPIPMLGFKRFRNVPYDDWREKFEGYVKLNKDTFELEPKKPGAIELAFKIDILLGKTLASTYYDAGDNTIKWKNRGGLLTLSTLTGKSWRPSTADVRYLREFGMGNHKGNFATAYGTSSMNTNFENDKVNPRIVRLWNSLDGPMRLMLGQRWVWFGMHRCSDMICDAQDWDYIPEQIDGTAKGFEGLTPTDTSSGIGTMFGFGETA